MASRRDKEKVIDEVWDDDRIASFLQRASTDATSNADHVRLIGAYQSMRCGDFRRFLTMFVAQGGAVDAPDDRGRSLADIVSRHRHGTEFIDALRAHGARPPIEAVQQET